MKRNIRLAVTACLALGLLTFAKSSVAAEQTWLENIGVRGAVDWGVGRAENPNQTIKTRTLSAFGLSAMPGYKIGAFMPGVLAEYRFIGQLTDPVDVGQTNLRGWQYLLGVGTTFQIAERWTLMGSFDFWGSYKLSKTTIVGQESKYQSPLGFRVAGGYVLNSLLPWTLPVKLSAEANFKYVAWGKTSLGGDAADIGGNKLHQWTAGVGLSAYY